MAIGWLTVIKMVPWVDLVSNAPKLAEGAKKLWDSAAKKSPPSAQRTSHTSANLSPEAQAIAGLTSQVASLQQAVTDLQQEMLDSSKLIKALADQNAQLVQRTFWLRRWLLLVGVATSVCLILLFIR